MIELIKNGPDGKPVGVGLSAVQVGKPIRLFVAKNTKNSQYQIFINPEIVQKGKKLTSGVPERENKFEGCLSIPRIFGLVKRPAWIKLKYQTPEGRWQTKKFKGFFATILQHEYDHLEGILFTDLILKQKGAICRLEKTPEGEKLIEIN